MTLLPEQRQEIIRIRIENASQSLKDARILLKNGSLRGAANRIYYAAFYAVSAFAVSQGKFFRKHSGLISFFHADCVHTGMFEHKYGKILQKAFEDRSEADYEDDIEIDANEMAAQIEDVDSLIDTIKRLLANAKE